MEKKKENEKKDVKKVKKDETKTETKKDTSNVTKKVDDKKINKDRLIVAIVVAVVFILLIIVCFTLVAKNSHKEIDLDSAYATISEMQPYKDMTTLEIDSYILSSLYDIEEGTYERAVGKMPMLNVQASMFLVIKANEGQVDAIKEKVEAYGNAQEEQWSRYLPEQYELVKNRKVGVVGNYVYLIIGENAEEVEKVIK